MVDTTQLTLRRRLVDRDYLPWLGFYSTATADLTATTLTDTARFKDTSGDSTIYQGREMIGRYLFRPARGAGQRIRDAGTFAPSTGVLTQLGDNLTESLSDRDYWILAIHPDILNSLLQQTFDELDQMGIGPAPGFVVDGDMESSGLTNWTVVGGATRTKKGQADSAALTLPGKPRSLEVVIPTAATDGVDGDVFNVMPGSTLRFFTAARAQAGTPKLSVLDNDSGATLGSIEHSYRGWAAGMLEIAIPSTTNNVKPRLGGAVNGTTAQWGYCVAYSQQETFVAAPSHLDTETRFSKLRNAEYLHALASNWWLWRSRRWRDLQKSYDFYLENVHQAANAYNIIAADQGRWKSMVSYELWIESKRRASAFALMTNDAAGESVATQLPAELVLSKWATLICEFLLTQTKGDHPQAAASLPLMQRKLIEWDNHMTDETPQQPKTGLVFKIRTLR